MGARIMKLYWILLAFGASITAQKSSLLVNSGTTLSAQTQAVSGTAVVEGIVRQQLPNRTAADNVLVKLFPDPDPLGNPNLIRSARTDQYGHFEIHNVVPGRYRAIAIMGSGPEDLKAEAAIAKAAGQKFEVADKQAKGLSLDLYYASH
jgi:hypothetical protein